MNLITTAKKTLSAVSALLKVAGADREMKEAGCEVAKSVLTLTKFLNVLLLPLKGVNWLFLEWIPNFAEVKAVSRHNKRERSQRTESYRGS